MYRLYYCPNCRSTIYSGDRFCGNCGVSLKWVEVQMPPASSDVPHNKPDGIEQNEYQRQQDHCQQEQQKESIRHLHNDRIQKTASASSKRQFKENTGSSQTVVQDKNKPSDNNKELLKNEVSKLLESFLEKVA